MSDKKVSVEMTEKQKEKFVESQAAAEVAAEVRLADVDLRFYHRINGTQYGPGKVRVEAGIGAALMEADQRAYHARLAESQEKSNMIHVFGRGVSTIVPVKG